MHPLSVQGMDRAAGPDAGGGTEVREFVARGGKSMKVPMFAIKMCVCAGPKTAPLRNEKMPTEAGLGFFSCSWLLNYNSTFALLQLSTTLLYSTTTLLNYNNYNNYPRVLI